MRAYCQPTHSGVRPVAGFGFRSRQFLARSFCVRRQSRPIVVIRDVGFGSRASAGNPSLVRQLKNQHLLFWNLVPVTVEDRIRLEILDVRYHTIQYLARWIFVVGNEQSVNLPRAIRTLEVEGTVPLLEVTEFAKNLVEQFVQRQPTRFSV